jgi:nucleoside-diphosphate kinase
MTVQRTLVLVKPDAMERRLGGEIIARIEKANLKVVAMKMIWMDRKLAQRHYAVHRDKPFFNDLVEFITSGPVIAAVFEGEDAIERVRKTMGGTDPKKAAPGTIRHDLAENIQKNLVHGSDAEDTARTEIAIFFDEEEILDYPTVS